MSKTRLVPLGALAPITAPLTPAKPAVEASSRLPGGLPPVPYRNPWRRAGDTGRSAREVFKSKEIKGEHFAEVRWARGDAKWW